MYEGRGQRRRLPERSWPDAPGERRRPNRDPDRLAMFVRGLLAVIGGMTLMVIFFMLLGLIWALLTS